MGRTVIRASVLAIVLLAIGPLAAQEAPPPLPAGVAPLPA
jgi:hypothetical protein